MIARRVMGIAAGVALGAWLTWLSDLLLGRRLAIVFWLAVAGVCFGTWAWFRTQYAKDPDAPPRKPILAFWKSRKTWVVLAAVLTVLIAWSQGTQSGVAAIVALAAVLLAWAPFLTRSDLERKRDEKDPGPGPTKDWP